MVIGRLPCSLRQIDPVRTNGIQPSRPVKSPSEQKAIARLEPCHRFNAHQLTLIGLSPTQGGLPPDAVASNHPASTQFVITINDVTSTLSIDTGQLAECQFAAIAV